MQNEDTLWKAVVDGDQKAFELLFRLLYPPLLLYAQRYMGDSVTCEDIVQDVFANLWEARESLIIHSSIRSYLTVAVRNRCYNRSHQAWFADQIHNRIALMAEQQNTEVGTDDIYLLSELRQKYNEALSKLPKVQQELFKLHNIQHLTYDEITQMMNISVRTAKRYKKNVVEKLREELKDYL